MIELPVTLREPLLGEPVLEIRDLSKVFVSRRGWFGRRRRTEAIMDVDLTIRAGEFVGLVGESGSGKSTLARLVFGLERPTVGTIRLCGENVTNDDAAARSKIVSSAQMVFQDAHSALNPRRRVESLITQAMEVARAPASRHQDRNARAMSLLRETGLPPDTAPRFPHQLSGGQLQRVNIARALCVTPRLLVADEIVSSLDVSVQAQILNLLLDLRAERGIALLFISHDLSVVRYLCSRVVVMYRGRVVEEGLTEEIFSRPRHPYTQALIDAVPPDPAAKWDPMERVAAFAEAQ
jgi:peptide/nickel transport system ATP-binding protein